MGMLFSVNFSLSGKSFRVPESFTNNPKCQMGRDSLLQDELYNENADSLLIISGTSGCYYNKSLFPKHR